MTKEEYLKDPVKYTVLIVIVLFTAATMSFGAVDHVVPTKVVVSEFPEHQTADTVAGNLWQQFGVRRISGGTFSEIYKFVENDIRNVRIHQGMNLGDWRSPSTIESLRQARSNRLWLLITFKDGSSATLRFDHVPTKDISRMYASARLVKKTVTRAVANGNSGQFVITEVVGRKLSSYPQLDRNDLLFRILSRRSVRVEGSVATQVSDTAAVTTSVDMRTF